MAVPQSHRNRRKLKLHQAVMAVDALEPRRLLASTLDTGVLTVTGTTGNDNISIALVGTTLSIDINGAARLTA